MAKRSNYTTSDFERHSRASQLAWARKHRTQYTGAKADHMCGWCGYIYDGPHTGEKLVGHKPTNVNTYKGVGISHGACDPACAANEAEAQMRLRRRK